MVWLIFICVIAAAEHIAHPFLTVDQVWNVALDAKYLSLACVLQALLAQSRQKDVVYRSVVALFCIGAWVDSFGRIMWRFLEFDASIPVMVGFSLWLISTAKRGYWVQGDHVSTGNIYILIHRPKTTWAVIKALIGFPADSISSYANGQAWSFRRNSGMFSRYSAGPAILSANIAVDTGVELSADLEEILDNLVGQSRFPGTKCVWTIRHVLRKIGGKFAPRWCDYIPGIYAAKLLRGRQ